MIITNSRPVHHPDPVLASKIDNGTVFTGHVWECSQLHGYGTFLKAVGHVVCLSTGMVYGAGATSTTRVFDYRSWPQSVLDLRD